MSVTAIDTSLLTAFMALLTPTPTTSPAPSDPAQSLPVVSRPTSPLPPASEQPSSTSSSALSSPATLMRTAANPIRISTASASGKRTFGRSGGTLHPSVQLTPLRVDAATLSSYQTSFSSFSPTSPMSATTTAAYSFSSSSSSNFLSTFVPQWALSAVVPSTHSQHPWECDDAATFFASSGGLNIDDEVLADGDDSVVWGPVVDVPIDDKLEVYEKIFRSDDDL